MNTKVSVPHFETGSYSERCSAFFHHDQDWKDIDEVTSPGWKKRTVMWTHYPYRYWLEQSGVESQHFFRQNTIEHKMFQVALLSMTRMSDGLRELEHWYIVQRTGQAEQVHHFSHLVDELEVEKLTGELNKNTDFAIDNGLIVPNSEDTLRLDYILQLGELDGSEACQ